MAAMTTSEIMTLYKEWYEKASGVNSLSEAQKAVGEMAKCGYYLSQHVRELQNLATVVKAKKVKPKAKKAKD